MSNIKDMIVNTLGTKVSESFESFINDTHEITLTMATLSGEDFAKVIDLTMKTFNLIDTWYISATLDGNIIWTIRMYREEDD